MSSSLRVPTGLEYLDRAVRALFSCRALLSGIMPLAAAVLLACQLVAIDGDTLRCGRERIRLLGIDAPELPGHCRRGRTCAPGDPRASKEYLARALRGRAVIERHGVDRYGRTLALVRVGGADLSCRQLRAKQAIYIARWDAAGLLSRRCARAD